MVAGIRSRRAPGVDFNHPDCIQIPTLHPSLPRCDTGGNARRRDATRTLTPAPRFPRIRRQPVLSALREGTKVRILICGYRTISSGIKTGSAPAGRHLTSLPSVRTPLKANTYYVGESANPLGRPSSFTPRHPRSPSRRDLGDSLFD